MIWKVVLPLLHQRWLPGCHTRKTTPGEERWAQTHGKPGGWPQILSIHPRVLARTSSPHLSPQSTAWSRSQPAKDSRKWASSSSRQGHRAPTRSLMCSGHTSQALTGQLCAACRGDSDTDPLKTCCLLRTACAQRAVPEHGRKAGTLT